jgi:hypothetical protein
MAERQRETGDKLQEEERDKKSRDKIRESSGKGRKEQGDKDERREIHEFTLS